MASSADSTKRRRASLRPSDLRGLSRLGIDAAVGVTNLVEAMHHTIASGGGMLGRSPEGRTAGITGLVYRSVRGTTRVVGHGADALLGALVPAADSEETAPRREAMLAALNGVWGDHLERTGNPLAIGMNLRRNGRSLDTAALRAREVTPRLAVLVHGLCMNDLQWLRNGHDHGAALAREFGFTPLYLHYNSGRHVSQNGREFAALLEGLVAGWPVPLEELVLIGHSMGGLVIRSACHYGAEAGHAWPAALRKLVFLGTPHHGAPLERGGHLVDSLFGLSPYVAPFARLGKSRSAGIRDLRFGNLQDADWQHHDGHAQKHDDRQPTPLPRGVKTYLVAATTAARTGGLHGALVADGLVPLASALGEHRDPALRLRVPRTQQHVVHGANHWDLLERPEVYERLRTWLA